MAFPLTALPTTVDLYIDGAWVDVTDDVLGRGGTGAVVTRGRGDEAAQVAPSACALSFFDPAGTYAPKNARSPYYELIGRNTPLRVGVGRIIDTFNGRTVVDGLGTTSDGQGTWSIVSSPSSFDVASGVATIAISGVRRTAYVGTFGDVDVLAKVSTDILTGNPEFGVATHIQSNGSCWAAALVTDGTDRLRIQKFADGSVLPFATSYTVPGGIVAGTAYWIRMQHAGHAVRARVWVNGDPEPSDWHVSGMDDQDTLLSQVPATGGAGVFAYLGTSAVISVDSFQADSWRFHGEVSAWPQRWGPGGHDVWVPVQAAGITRRLVGRGAPPLKSPLYRDILADVNTPTLMAYWPVEDESGATSIASGLSRGPAMSIRGTGHQLASNSEVPGAAPLMVAGSDTQLRADVRVGADTGQIKFRMVTRFPAAGLTDGTIICEVGQIDATVRKWQLRYRTGGDLELRAIDNDFAVTATSGAIDSNLNGLLILVGFEVVQDGADVDYQIAYHTIDPDGTDTGFAAVGTFAAHTVGASSSISVATAGGMGDCIIGHIAVMNSTDSLDNIAPAFTGHVGETVAARIVRLCGEESVPVAIIGAPSDSAEVGPQRIDTLMALLRDAAAADGGILYEPRDFLGLLYRTRNDLYSQDPAAAFNYAAGEIAPSLEPTDDDQRVVNDVKAARINGSSFRATKDEGPLSILDPPDGIGRYETDVSVNVRYDEQLRDVATWAVHLGTWDEARYPAVSIDHGALGMQGKTALSVAAAQVDVGDIVTIDNPPPWLPPEQIVLMAEGYSETINADEWKQTLNCSPGSPWTVFTLNSSRLTSGGASLTSGESSTGTAWEITTQPGSALWSTTDEPWDLMVAGERVTVTASNDTTSPQDVTVTRSVNGIVKAQSVGAPVQIFQPSVLAR